MRSRTKYSVLWTNWSSQTWPLSSSSSTNSKFTRQSAQPPAVGEENRSLTRRTARPGVVAKYSKATSIVAMELNFNAPRTISMVRLASHRTGESVATTTAPRASSMASTGAPSKFTGSGTMPVFSKARTRFFRVGLMYSTESPLDKSSSQMCEMTASKRGRTFVAFTKTATMSVSDWRQEAEPFFRHSNCIEAARDRNASNDESVFTVLKTLLYACL
mmetsp:Transcript_21378/g.72405  ORF Transcript_21378/g.72405 Transcript_21378/m.72405 type:complete len:217 (+) Transcript_21378:456-1106(+)